MLIIRTFNKTLAMKMSIIILPVKVGVKEITTTCHVIEGKIQYNLLLGYPWIEDMDIVLSTLHRFLNYLHNGMVHCIIGNKNPFNH